MAALSPNGDKENSMNPVGKNLMSAPAAKRTRRYRSVEEAATSQPAASQTPVTPSTLKGLVQEYQHLTEEMSNLDIRPENTEQNANRASCLMQEADRLADVAYNVHGSNTATVYDGEFMSATGQVVHQIAETMEVGTRTFCVKDFVIGLKQLLASTGRITKTQLSDFRRQDCMNRIDVGNVPVLKYMYGSYDFTPKSADQSEQQEQPAPKKRNKLVISPVKTQTAVIQSKERLSQVDKDQTVIEVEEMNRKLKKMYHKNGRKPVPYLTVVVDPDDFSKTVENVFHFSFLFKDGWAKSLTHKGITTVIPVPEEDRKMVKSARCQQVVLSFSMHDWRKWCEKIQTQAYHVPR